MRPIIAVIFVAGLTLTVAADVPRAPRPPQAPEPPPLTCHGRAFVWDHALEKYRPAGQGWYWDKGSVSWCRDVPAHPQYHAPAWQPPPMYAPTFAAPCPPGGS